MGTGRAVLRAKATEAGGQRRGRGRAPPEYPCIWDSSGAALGRRGAGDRKTAPSSLSPLAPRACLGTGEVFRRADGAAWPNPASFLEFFSKPERSLFNFRSPSELRGASSAPQPTWRSPGSSYMAASFSISGRHLWGLLCFLLGAGLFLDRTHPGPGKGTRGAPAHSQSTGGFSLQRARRNANSSTYIPSFIPHDDLRRWVQKGKPRL